MTLRPHLKKKNKALDFALFTLNMPKKIEVKQCKYTLVLGWVDLLIRRWKACYDHYINQEPNAGGDSSLLFKQWFRWLTSGLRLLLNIFAFRKPYMILPLFVFTLERFLVHCQREYVTKIHQIQGLKTRKFRSKVTNV